ncbi:MAG: hypothetical protein LWW95_10530 [Candidatus Desulfofervidus auxilii]|nr:hypothetical protein [Candidatus Desulfofervidus auxilii]
MLVIWGLIFCLSFIFPFTSALAKPSTEILIEFKEIKKVNSYIFGHNTLAYDPCTYEGGKNCINHGQYTNFGAGQWDPILRKPNTVLVDLAKKIKVSVLRFPGGCGTHHYNWKKAIGPIEKRPMYKFGIDEFMELCKAIGAKPIITLSYFTGTCQDLADLVEYLNAPLGTNPNGGIAWAEVRAKNGHPEPYGVKWFEFGNEVWHGDHRKISAVDPREYARRYLKCRQLIKNVDPKVKLGAVIGESPYGLDWWGRTVLNIVKDKVDFVVIHIYRPGYRSNKNEIPAKELFKITLASPDQIKDILERIKKELKDLTGREIPIAITEYNGSFIQQKPVPYRHSLGNALFIADLLRVFITAEVPILCANYWQFSNSYWGLVYNPNYMKGRGKYYKRPNYYVFDLYANHFGDILLNTTVKSETYFQPGYRKILPSGILQKLSVSRSNDNKFLIKPVFRWLPSCVKLEKCFDYCLKLNFNCENKNMLGLFFYDEIQTKSNWLYSCEFEIKTENLSNFWFNIQVKDQNNKTIKTSRILKGNFDWTKVGFDFKTSEDMKLLKLMFFACSEENKIEGNIYIRNMKIEELGPAPQYGPTPYISAIASTNEKKDKIYIMVINKNLNEPMKTQIKINGFKFKPIVRAWILNGSSVDTTNEGCRERAKIHYKEVKINPKEGSFYFTFEPHSVTALELIKKED